MKNGVLLGTCLWALVIGACVWGAVKKPAIAGVPDQAQASNLAVPDEPAELPYAGAVVVVQCKNVIGLVMIKHNGKQEAINLQGLSPKDVTALLLQAPADDTGQFEVACPVVKGSGSV